MHFNIRYKLKHSCHITNRIAFTVSKIANATATTLFASKLHLAVQC